MVNTLETRNKRDHEVGHKRIMESTVSKKLETQKPSAMTISPQKKKQGKTEEFLSGNWNERLSKAVNEDVYLPEVFRVLRSRILHPWDNRPIPKSIVVTSATPKEGKSFITANLGISLAQAVDQHSLLVDYDLRKPSLASLFGIDYKIGLVDYLRDNVELSELIAKTSLSKLSILASGKPPVNPAELLGSARMLSLVKELSQRYEDRIIIFDTPPMLVAAETAVLASQVDAVIIVVRQGRSGKTQVKQLIDSIGTEKILGVVFNANTVNYFERKILKGYGYYDQSYYRSGA